jgi:Ca2+-binding RTX toxin-like protein
LAGLGNGGRSGADTILGGSGGDLLIGGAGGDQLFGGLGNDTIVLNPGDLGGGEKIDGETGTDTLMIGATAVADLRMSLVTTGLSGIEVLAFAEATDFAKTVRLSAHQMDQMVIIDGNLGAADRLSILMGEAANIDLSGLRFVDWDTGAAENDRQIIAGDLDDETYIGSSRADYISASAGNDTINGGRGDDSLRGGDGDDSISAFGGAADGHDWLDGGNGFDLLLIVLPAGGSSLI